MPPMRGPLPPGLIVNADDLGIHPSINAGILSAYQNGILTSCTMLMTTAYRDETVRDYVRTSALPIGIHLSLTLGKAVAPASVVPDLIDEDLNLKYSADRLLLSSFRSAAGRRVLDQIRSEIDAQLSIALDCGVRPTHADAHQHVHMNPAIFNVIEELLPRYGIDRLRFARERFHASVLGPDLPAIMARMNPAKWALLRWRSMQVNPRLVTTDDFFGVLYSGAVSKAAMFALIAKARSDRSLEICIHPGFPAPKGEQIYPRPGYNEFISSDSRQNEHDLLIADDVRDLVLRRGLTLRSFDGLAKS